MGILLDIKRKINKFEYTYYKINDIVKINENNDYSKLEDYNKAESKDCNKAGIYIFFDKNKIPVYIGSAKSNHGLNNRIAMQLTPGKGNSSLSVNIAFYHKECGNYINGKYEIKKSCVKRVLLKYINCFCIIQIKDENIVVDIEKYLIFKYKLKYNATYNIKKIIVD